MSIFSQEKATAATAYILRLCGGRMSYLALIKLLYLTDREALHRWGFDVTTDRYVSMKHGPVVSNTYDLMISDDGQHEFWSQFITPPLGEYEIELKSEAIPEGYLSRAEELLLAEIHSKFGSWDRWALRDYTHTLPEWKNPGHSSIPISIRDILKAQGNSEQEIVDVLSDLNAAQHADTLLGGR